MAGLPAVTALLLHYNAMYTWTDCNVLSTGWSAICCIVCSFCSPVTLNCYGYMD